LTFSDVDHIIIFVDLSLLWGLIVHLLPVQGVVNFLLDGPAQGLVMNMVVIGNCFFGYDWFYVLSWIFYFGMLVALIEKGLGILLFVVGLSRIGRTEFWIDCC